MGVPWLLEQTTMAMDMYGYIKDISGTWTQQGSDIDGEAASDQSGYSVSLSSDGSTVAIGAYGTTAMDQVLDMYGYTHYASPLPLQTPSPLADHTPGLMA